MGKNAPFWKGKLVDRVWLKAEIKVAFKRCAKGDLEEEIGRLVNNLERYVAGEVLNNTKDVMKGIRQTLDDAAKFLGEYAEGISKDQIRRRAENLSDED